MSDTVTTPADTPGNSPGAVLKRCREYHGITLDEASQNTKIAVSYLKHLEEDHIGGFANLAYLKGFLRIYATYLGLNPDDMARMYDKLFGTKEEKGRSEQAGARNRRPALRLVPLRKLALPAVLLLVIILTATLFKRQPTQTISLSPPPTPSAPALPAAPVHSVVTSAKIRPAPAAAEEPGMETRAGGKSAPDKQVVPAKPAGFILKIRVVQNGALNASVDGSPPQPYELTVGDVIEWKVERTVALDLNNAGCVEAELNGRSLRQLGPSGKASYVVIDADGVRQ